MQIIIIVSYNLLVLNYSLRNIKLLETVFNDPLVPYDVQRRHCLAFYASEIGFNIRISDGMTFRFTNLVDDLTVITSTNVCISFTST